MYTTEKIRYAYYTKGFASFFASAPQGTGKSRFELHVLHDVYQDWDKVKKFYFFERSPEDFTVKLRELNAVYGRVPAIALDDMGAWFIKYEWHNRTNIMLYKIFNLIRNRVSGVVASALDQEDIVKFLRGKFMYEVFFAPEYDTKNPLLSLQDRWVTATVYRQNRQPGNRFVIVREFSDTFNLEVPRDIQDWEWNRRQEVVELLERDMENSKFEFNLGRRINSTEKHLSAAQIKEVTELLLRLYNDRYFLKERKIDEIMEELQKNGLPSSISHLKEVSSTLEAMVRIKKLHKRNSDGYTFIQRSWRSW
jgi:hypothetical protein